MSCDVVQLASGGLDSTLVSVLCERWGVRHQGLFIDYGQRAVKKEWAACRAAALAHRLPEPVYVDVSGYGRTMPSGLTNESLDVFMDAFLPGRNLLFLLIASSYAYQVNARAVSIGLLSEESAIFPDQSDEFINHAQEAIRLALDYDIEVLTPLRTFAKRDVIAMANEYGISSSYSCHLGTEDPCGYCVACREFSEKEV